MKPTEERLDLAPEEREFVARLAASFGPTPLSGPQRAAFDAALAERIGRHRLRRRRFLLGGLPAAVAAGLAGVWLATGDGAPEARNARLPAQAWEEEVLLLDASFDSDADLQVLPEEYLAIESAML